MAEQDNWRLDQDDLTFLTDVEKETLSQLEKLVQSPGWEIVTAWAKANAEEQTHFLINARSWDENRVAWAGRFVYNQLANFEQVLLSEFKVMAQQRAVERAKDASEEDEELV